MLRKLSQNKPPQRSSKQQHERLISILSKYAFLTPLVVTNLEDKDVLTSLLLANKEIRVDLKGYCLKQLIGQCDFEKVSCVHRYLPVGATRIKAISLPIPLSPGWNHSLLKEIIFDDQFDQPVPPGSIPDSITHLSFGRCFNQSIPIGSIPSSVTNLKFGYSFEQLLKSELFLRQSSI